MRIASTGLVKIGTGTISDNANQIQGNDQIALSADTGLAGGGSAAGDGGTNTFEAYVSLFVIYKTDGQSALFFAEYQSATVIKVCGSTEFAAGSSSGNIRVYTSSSNATVTVKNYTNATANLKIITLGY